MGATKELAAYVVSAQLDTIPQDVRHEAHRALLNYVGCAVGGAREPAVDIACGRSRPIPANRSRACSAGPSGSTPCMPR